MNKNLLQDMVIKKRKRMEEMKKISSQPENRVSIPMDYKTSTKVDDLNAEHSGVETRFASVYDVINKQEEGNHKKSKHALWVVAAVSVAFLLFALSFLFSGVKITVTPKVKDLAVNANFSAMKDGKPEDLPFELIVNSGEENLVVPSGEERDVAESAEGVVVIYNAFSSANQRLDINTRLEGSNGKIYKTKIPTTVPGMKGSTPGSVEVGIFAAEAGEDYNSSPLDFKIFGFKGTPKYSKFYARSKGDISGGFKGKKSDISLAEKERIVKELEVTLKEKLFKRAIEQIPNGFVLWKDATILTTGDENIKFTSVDNTILVNVKGTLSGFLFEEKKLTEKIAKEILPNEDTMGVYIPNIKDLIFTLSDKENSLSEIKNISFNLSGNVRVVWTIEDEEIITDLLGQSKKNFNQILLKYPNIDRAQLSFRPFWKRSFPTESTDIKFIVNYP